MNYNTTLPAINLPTKTLNKETQRKLLRWHNVYCWNFTAGPIWTCLISSRCPTVTQIAHKKIYNSKVQNILLRWNVEFSFSNNLSIDIDQESKEPSLYNILVWKSDQILRLRELLELIISEQQFDLLKKTRQEKQTNLIK